MVEEGFFLAGAVSFFVRVAACPRRVRARVCVGVFAAFILVIHLLSS